MTASLKQMNDFSAASLTASSPQDHLYCCSEVKDRGKHEHQLGRRRLETQVVSFCQKSVLMCMYSVFHAVFPSCLSLAALSVLKVT